MAPKLDERAKVKRLQGLCLDCNQPPTEGHWRCVSCFEKKRQLKEQLCRYCSKPPEPGFKLCERHREDAKVKMREFRAARKAAGLCYRCDDPVRPGGLLCEKHRRQVTKEERPKGYRSRKCELCKKDCGPAYYCQDHRVEGRRIEEMARTIKSRASGRCSFCHIHGHAKLNCRAFAALSPVLQDLDYKNLNEALLSLSDAQPGDILVWLFREPIVFEGVTHEGSTLTVRYGGRILLGDHGFLTPIGADGTFRYTTSPKGWQCVNRTIQMKASNLSLETPISNVFGMASVRTTNVFSELMLRTVGDLCQLGRKKLLATRNFGQRSMQEVDQMLAAHNLPPLV